MSEKIQTGEVPRYSLLGEDGAVSDAEFIHVEDIPSRGALYRWQIPPHTHPGLFQVVMVARGRARAHFDDKEADMPPGSVILVPPGCVHTFQFQPDTDGFVLTATETTVHQGDGTRESAFWDSTLGVARIIDLTPSPTNLERVTSMFANILAEFNQPAIGRERMLDHLLQALMLMLRRECARQGAPKGAAGVRLELFNRFRGLVEAHYRDHWAIPQYASALNASESRLNRVCRELVGRSAFDMANDRLLLEAKRKLIYIAAPVAALAYELGFQDPAYFSRYFRRHTGLSPLEYRDKTRATTLSSDTNFPRG